MATAIEYGLIATFIGVAAIATFGLFSDEPAADKMSPTQDALASTQVPVYSKENEPTITFARDNGSYIITCPVGTVMMPDISKKHPRKGVCIKMMSESDDYE